MARTKLPADIKKPDQPKIIGTPTTFPKPGDTVEPTGGDGQPLAPLVPSRDGLIVPMKWPAATAAEEEPIERVNPPVPKRYKVTKGGQFFNSGTPAQMRVGKVISDVEYNVASLQRQGIELELL